MYTGNIPQQGSLGVRKENLQTSSRRPASKVSSYGRRWFVDLLASTLNVVDSIQCFFGIGLVHYHGRRVVLADITMQHPHKAVMSQLGNALR